MNQLTTHALNGADYIIIAVILFSTMISLLRGFISEAISLLTWIVAAIVAFRSAEPMSHLLSGLIHHPTLRLIIGFALVFIIILIIGSLINHFLAVFVRSAGLSGPNRLLGMVFGFARGVLLVAIFLLFAKLTSMSKNLWWQTSVLIPYLLGVTNWLQQLIPQNLLHFNHLSRYLPNSHPGAT